MKAPETFACRFLCRRRCSAPLGKRQGARPLGLVVSTWEVPRGAAGCPPRWPHRSFSAAWPAAADPPGLLGWAEPLVSLEGPFVLIA